MLPRLVLYLLRNNHPFPMYILEEKKKTIAASQTFAISDY